MRFVLAFIFLLALFLPEGLMAQNPGGESDPGSEEAALDLLKVFDEATEIATKSKLNADYVPGMVTVLHGKDLQARGVQNLWEALALVPGFDISIRASTRKVVVRGVGNIFASGNIKFMWNSVPMNNIRGGTANALLRLPITQVDRIEIIRGPGSAVHGEYAYIGVVNVVTRKEGGQLYSRAGSFNAYEGGGVYSWANPEKDFKLSLNVAGSTSDGADVQTGPDVLFGTVNEPISLAPGPTNEDSNHISAGLFMDYKDFSLKGQFLHTGRGEMFGDTDALPPPTAGVTTKNTEISFEARQNLDLLPSLEMKLHLGWWQNKIKVDNDNFLFPPGYFGIFPDGLIAGISAKERRVYGGTDWVWKGWSNHTILFSWSTVWTKLVDASFTTTFLPSTGAPAPLQTYRGSENWIKEGEDRLLNSLAIQDEYSFSSDLTFTLGLRYDHYDDVGDRLTPRIAGVYRLTDHHILKFQYAQAFRPPTFLELYSQNNTIADGNPNIKPAVIDTFETGYIYKADRTVVRTTLYYSELDDLIINQGGVFQNSRGAKQMGIELEWEREITSSFKLNSNLTWVQTEDRDTGEDVEGSANLLANIGVNYRPVQDLMFNVQYRYVGPRHRDPSDSRADLGGYNNVNFTANWFKPLGYKGWTLRGGIRNLFDEDIRYAAPANTYPQDYPRPGINFWAQLSIEF